MRQSVCLPIMRLAGTPLREFLAAVREIGFSGVEIFYRDEHFDEFVSLCRELDLTLASMIGHRTLSEGLNDVTQHDRIEAELRESIDVAARRGIPGLICFSGNRRDGEDDAVGIAATAEGLRRVAPYAEERGVNLNLELLNSRIDHPGYQCDHTSWGVAVCREVGSPRVKLLYDIYHMQIMEGDIIRTIRDNIQWIGHFHTAGVPGRNDIDDSQELAYGTVCEAIAGTQYDLYLGHEFRPKAEPLEALRKAYAICDRG
ncbi:MAG: TIM barrel protein [Lentisphaerae bacterium]|nr:TIM barrel protein [Lentisphaerota bacterium]